MKKLPNCYACKNYKKHKVKLHHKRAWQDMYVCEAVYECQYEPREEVKDENRE